MKLSLVIPCYNEEACLPLVIPELVQMLDARTTDYELILVNNGSLDRTGAFINEWAQNHSHIKAIHLPANRLYGGGVLAGLQEACGEIVGHHCADGQIKASDVGKILDQALLQKGSFVVKAKRIHQRQLGARIISSFLWRQFSRLLFGAICQDINATPKFYSRQLLNQLELTSQGDFLDGELMFKAKQKGAHIDEIAIPFFARVAGESKVGKKFFSHTWNFCYEAIVMRLKHE